MPPANATVQVMGLRALMRDLAKASDEHAGIVIDYMKKAGRQAAAPVAAEARSRMLAGTTPSKKGPHLTDDIRVTATRTGAAVRMGRARMPWAGWIEFGGARHRPVESSRPFFSNGRYLFPAARALQANTARLYSDAVGEAFTHFSWTNTGSDPHD